MITLFCSPRHIDVLDEANGEYIIGLPTVLDGMSVSGGSGLVSDTTHVPNLNLCIWEADLTQAEIDAISANPDGYVFDMDRLQQGDATGFAQWLTDRGVTKSSFLLEASNMGFGPSYAHLVFMIGVVRDLLND